MPRRRRGEPQRLDLNLTPLLDVILQLITFFMMLVHVSSKIEASEQVIRLPVAPAGLPTGVLGDDRLIVTIDASGALLPGAGGPLPPGDIPAWWAEQAQLRKEGLAALSADPGMLAELPTRVLVRADREAPYGAVRSALSSAQAGGFARFSLVVLRSED